MTSASQRISVLSILLLLFFVMIGCQYDPHAHLLTLEEPSREDVIGTYVVDYFSLPSELAGKSCEITVELRADGSFSASNIPPWRGDIPDAGFFNSLLNGTGRWEIDKMGTLNPREHTIWGIYLRNDTKKPSTAPDVEDDLNRLMSPASFTGQKPPYGLIFQLGDPDRGYAILMKKKS